MTDSEIVEEMVAKLAADHVTPWLDAVRRYYAVVVAHHQAAKRLGLDPHHESCEGIYDNCEYSRQELDLAPYCEAMHKAADVLGFPPDLDGTVFDTECEYWKIDI